MSDFFHPCVSMKQGMARARYKADFALPVAAEILMKDGEFTEVRHSERLGLIKTYGKVRVILFSHGEVTVQPFRKQEDAYRYLKELSMKLWDAQVCPESGRAVFGCSLPECGEECWAKTKSHIPLLYEREYD